ncbi:hypothetical protein N7457_001633 [Penicillium paradoxum]|uniref:uncharacterized protein n=1 Tax=Penicillium paradoxum TaxID=176176 RepID=UPI002547EF0F|nr:uncharacterized protein N7457_001633 [Penicillium paradoxum]KAJ5795034.1 hypothetical protein N7457_001633 [Penicillium paradoxum]
MERKLSKKAKMRERLAFSRSNSARGRPPTLVSLIPASPTARLRSASNPESPIHDAPTWDSSNPNSSRGYIFTDEPGYFRPASPFIERQDIEEDLEAHIQHACALLSHSIDRGIPAGLSYQSAMPDWRHAKRPVDRLSVEASPGDQDLLLVPGTKLNQSEIETNKHDSGPLTDKHKILQQTSSLTTAKLTPRIPLLQPKPRINNSRRRLLDPLLLPQPSNPLPSQPPQPPNRPATQPPKDPTSPLNSPDKRLESVPQPKLKLSSPTNPIPTSESSTSTPISPPSLGEPGRTWLRASKDIQHLIDDKKTKKPPKHQKHQKPKMASETPRFYRTCNRTTGAFDSREWLARNVWEDRPSSACDEASLGSSVAGSRPGTATPRLGSVSTNEEELPGGYPQQAWTGNGPGRGMSYSSSFLGDDFKHQENVYSVVVPSETPRRKKAARLFRKLTGLGLRLKENMR